MKEIFRGNVGDLGVRRAVEKGLQRIRQYFHQLSLAQRFMLTSLGIIILGTLGLGLWVGQQIRTGVINRAGATTALYVDSFVAPRLQELGHTGTLSQVNADTVSKLLSETSLGRQIVAFKVWDLAGRVVFSSDPSILNKTFPMHDALIEATQGKVSSRLSAEDAENEAQRIVTKEVLEIYSPVRLIGTNQVIGVAEYYQNAEAIRREIDAAERRSWLVVGGIMVGIYLLLSGFVRRASDTIDAQQLELNRQILQLRDLLTQNKKLGDRVRRAAMRISTTQEGLLRRVSADLHDGPAQDLGLALLQIDTVLGHVEQLPSSEKQHTQLQRIQTLLQGTLQEMRGIATEFSLPQLNDLSLEETFKRVARAHERRTDCKVELDLKDLPETAAQPVKITIYRVVQEALNNAYRYSGAVEQTVRAFVENERLVFEISDPGKGFDLQTWTGAEGHLGLEGMRERVESVGGQFALESASGKGTRILVELPLHVEGAANE